MAVSGRRVPWPQGSTCFTQSPVAATHQSRLDIELGYSSVAITDKRKVAAAAQIDGLKSGNGIVWDEERSCECKGKRHLC